MFIGPRVIYGSAHVIPSLLSTFSKVLTRHVLTTLLYLYFRLWIFQFYFMFCNCSQVFTFTRKSVIGKRVLTTFRLWHLLLFCCRIGYDCRSEGTENSSFTAICTIPVKRVAHQVDTVQICGVWSVGVIISCDAGLGADYLESPVYPTHTPTHPPTHFSLVPSSHLLHPA